MPSPLLKVDGLNVSFSTPGGEVRAVRDLDFAVSAGETLGVVGESGSGKTVAMLGMMGLLADNGRASGRALFDGRDLLAMNADTLRAVRGAGISMVFDDRAQPVSHHR